MWRDPLAGQRWAFLFGDFDVLRNHILNCIRAEPATPQTREEDVRGFRPLFPNPRFQTNDSRFGAPTTSFRPAFSFATNMRAVAEMDVLLPNRGDLGES